MGPPRGCPVGRTVATPAVSVRAIQHHQHAADVQRDLLAGLVLAPDLGGLDGLDEVDTLDNESIMELDEVPDHLLVIGGGYVGLEFAQMFARFGSRVTVIDRGEHVLSQEDEDISEEVESILRDEGLTLLQRATVQRAETTDSGVRLQVDAPGGAQSIRGSHLLVAAGRRPNTQSLKLDAAGVQVDDQGFVRVNDRLETNVSGIYALGDVKGGPAFTHVSYDDYRVLKANLVDGRDRSIADRSLLYTVFIDPQLGRLGLNERQAHEAGRKIRVAQVSMEQVARALETGETRGLMKAIVDQETDQILGCAILGLQGGEVMSMIQIAMQARIPYTDLRDGMFAHPLLAESLNTLFGSFRE